MRKLVTQHSLELIEREQFAKSCGQVQARRLMREVHDPAVGLALVAQNEAWARDVSQRAQAVDDGK